MDSNNNNDNSKSKKEYKMVKVRKQREKRGGGKFAVQINSTKEEDKQLLDSVKEFYRASSNIHAVRLALQDVMQIIKPMRERGGLETTV